MVQKQRFDLVLFLITITLVGIGLLMVYSSSAIFAQKYQTGDTYYYFKKQLLWIIFGLVALFIGWRIEYRKWQKWYLPILLIGIILLVMTLIPGINWKIGGASRWIKIWKFSFQPAEFIRLALVIYLAGFITRKGHNIKELQSGLLPPLLLVGFISSIILLQPHLGMVLILVVITIIILFIGGATVKHISCLSLAFIATTIVLILVSPYRFARLTAFLNPWKDPTKTGYHIIHSLIALGSGGLFGVGLGESKEKLFYLPESSTDFIFAIIGEEGGLILTSIVIALFIGFAYCGIKMSLQANDNFGSLLALGITSLITTQALLNMGVVTGMLPTTGMPLPFISFGGSALLINMFGIGILLNIFRNSGSKKPLLSR